jgi:hypothetical protein
MKENKKETTCGLKACDSKTIVFNWINEWTLDKI